MIKKGSRYETSRLFVADGQNATDFHGVRARDIRPTEGVLEHSIREGERLDLVALYYYNDPRLWWRILDANPHILCAADLMLDSSLVGTVLLIPPAGGGKR